MRPGGLGILNLGVLAEREDAGLYTCQLTALQSLQQRHQVVVRGRQGRGRHILVFGEISRFAVVFTVVCVKFAF